MNDDDAKDAIRHMDTIRHMREAIAVSDRMVQDALKHDPELASKSAEYQQGYVHGFTEARLAFLAWLAQQEPKP